MRTLPFRAVLALLAASASAAGSDQPAPASVSAATVRRLPAPAAAAVPGAAASADAQERPAAPASDRPGRALSSVPVELILNRPARAYDGQNASGAPLPGAAAAAAKAPAAAQAPSGLAPARSPGIDLSAIDRSADPCADFYQYACGAWTQNNPIPPAYSSYGRFTELHDRNQAALKEILEKAAAAAKGQNAEERKLGQVYGACMDVKAIEKRGAAPISGELASLARVSGPAKLAAAVAKLQLEGAGAVFAYGSEQDFNDASRVIAAADQSGLSLPDRDYYLEANYADDLKAFGEHVAKMLELSGDKPADAAREAAEVVAVETELARISMDNVSRRDPAKTHKMMKLADFAALTPSFSWDAYFRALGAKKPAELDVNSYDYFSRLQGVLSSQPASAWRSYLRWRVVHGNATMLSSAFDAENFAFFGKRLSGQKEPKPRWKRCVGVADSVMGEALGHAFVQRYFDPKAKAEVLRMIGEIEDAMKDDIAGSAWMSPATQAKALEKLSLVTNKIGYPDKWRDYTKLKISRGDALGNLRRSAELEARRDLAKIGKPADRTEWGMTPPTVNAYYDPSNNNINFPAGILQPPFYDAQADNAANMGAIGAVMGHELTHGFDDEGHQYDGKGNLQDWWLPQDQAAFETRAQGLVDQYSSFVVAKDPGGDPKKDVHVNGKLTLGENTADNGGVRLAFAAFMKEQAASPSGPLAGFTPEQRFFLGYGQVWCQNQTERAAKLQALTDPHSPARFRVNGTLSNMSEFGQAFSCAATAPMANPKPARIW